MAHEGDEKRRGMLELLDRLRSEDGLLDRFESAVRVLSLDAAQKLWPEMGLAFRRPAEVMGALRRFVDPEHDSHIVCLDEYTDEDEVWFAWRLFGEVALGEGEAAVMAIWNWFEISEQETRPWQWIWGILLTSLATEEPSALTRHGVSKTTTQRLQIKANAWSRYASDLETRMDVMWPEQHDYSTWDGGVCFDLDDEEVDYRDMVHQSIWRPAFGRAWRTISDSVTPSEMRGLMEWGKETYQELIADIDTSELSEPMPTVGDAVVPLEMRTRN